MSVAADRVKKLMSAAEAVTLLRRTATEETVEAIGTLIDHVAQLEMVVDLISTGTASALKNRPPAAVLNVHTHPVKR